MIKSKIEFTDFRKNTIDCQMKIKTNDCSLEMLKLLETYIFDTEDSKIHRNISHKSDKHNIPHKSDKITSTSHSPLLNILPSYFSKLSSSESESIGTLFQLHQENFYKNILIKDKIEEKEEEEEYLEI